MDLALIDRLEAALDEIRPALHADGGNVEIREVTSRRVLRVGLVGACAGCPLSVMTLKMAIERIVLLRVPDIAEVEADVAADALPGGLTG